MIKPIDFKNSVLEKSRLKILEKAEENKKADELAKSLRLKKLEIFHSLLPYFKIFDTNIIALNPIKFEINSANLEITLPKYFTLRILDKISINEGQTTKTFDLDQIDSVISWLENFMVSHLVK